MNRIGTRKVCGRELVCQLQYVPVRYAPLRVIKGSDMVLTKPGKGSSVNRYKSIIYTVDQVHRWGEGGS
jgi:hypothetical protein